MNWISQNAAPAWPLSIAWPGPSGVRLMPFEFAANDGAGGMITISVQNGINVKRRLNKLGISELNLPEGCAELCADWNANDPHRGLSVVVVDRSVLAIGVQLAVDSLNDPCDFQCTAFAFTADAMGKSKVNGTATKLMDGSAVFVGVQADPGESIGGMHVQFDRIAGGPAFARLVVGPLWLQL